MSGRGGTGVSGVPEGRWTPPLSYGGPEQMFFVTGFSVDGAHARGTMRLGDAHLDGGRVSDGALAVLVDDVLGYAAVAADAQRRWSVSTDISLELFRDLDPGSVVDGHAQAIHVADGQSVAECRVVDGEGGLVARAVQRGRYVPPALREPDGVDPYGGSAGYGIRARIGAALRETDGLPSLLLPVTTSLCNVLGALHGGIALCASQLAARSALDAIGLTRLAAKAIRITYPRPIVVGDIAEFSVVARHTGRSFVVLDVTGAVGDRVCTIAQVTAHPC